MSLRDVNQLNILCISCGGKISKTDQNNLLLKTSDWAGAVDIIHSSSLEGCYIIGCCKVCANKAMENGRLIKIGVENGL